MKFNSGHYKKQHKSKHNSLVDYPTGRKRLIVSKYETEEKATRTDKEFY